MITEFKHGEEYILIFIPDGSLYSMVFNDSNRHHFRELTEDYKKFIFEAHLSTKDIIKLQREGVWKLFKGEKETVKLLYT